MTILESLESELKDNEQKLIAAYNTVNELREKISSLQKQIAIVQERSKPVTTIARYAYRIYSSNDKPLGWLYTYNKDNDIAVTQLEPKWCKQWKTESGAKRSFAYWDMRVRQSKLGSYIKIELLTYDT